MAAQYTWRSETKRVMFHPDVSEGKYEGNHKTYFEGKFQAKGINDDPSDATQVPKIMNVMDQEAKSAKYVVSGHIGSLQTRANAWVTSKSKEWHDQLGEVVKPSNNPNGPDAALVTKIADFVDDLVWGGELRHVPRAISVRKADPGLKFFSYGGSTLTFDELGRRQSKNKDDIIDVDIDSFMDRIAGIPNIR